MGAGQSHRCNAFGEHDQQVTPHRAYCSLHANPAERQRDYRALVMDAVAPEELDAIRRHLQSPHAYGSNRIRAEVEAQLGRSVGPRKIGRPRRSG